MKRYFSTRHVCVCEFPSHNGVVEDTDRLGCDTDRRGTTHSTKASHRSRSV